MLKKEDKDGIIEFLKSRIETIRNIVDGISVDVGDDDDDDDSFYRHDAAKSNNAIRDEAVDLCDKTLAEVTF